MRKFVSAITASMLGVFVLSSGSPEAHANTLEKIQATNAIVLGVREQSVPFSFSNQQKEFRGYSLDLCMRVVDALRQHMQLRNLEVKLVPVKSANRITKLLDNTIDLECGSTTNTKERQKQVAFSYTTFVTGTRLLVKKSSDARSLSDLRGKVVVVTKGTTNEKILKALNYDENLGLTVVSANDHAESFSMVQSGSAAAFALDDILLAGLIGKSPSRYDYEIIGGYITIEPYALMFRKDDAEFESLINKTLSELFVSQQIVPIYNKWFRTGALNFPMSYLIKETFKAPNTTPAWP